MNQFLQCPKCHGIMRTYNRSGVQIEQCDNCHGIFLDYGELEALTRLESQWAQPHPGAHPGAHGGAPVWGAGQHGHGRGHGGHGFARMLFSS